MKETQVNTEHWSGFERETLPETLGVPAPRRTIVVARILVAAFLTFSLAALLAPWTQNIRGSGRVSRLCTRSTPAANRSDHLGACREVVRPGGDGGQKG